MCLRPPACWDCGLQPHRAHGWMSVVCVVVRVFCDELITRPVESYRLWCIVECDLQTSWIRRLWPTGGYCAKNKKNYIYTQIGFTKLSEITGCNKETKSRDSILYGTLQLVWLRFSSVNVHKQNVNTECKWNTTKPAIHHNQQIRRRANT